MKTHLAQKTLFTVIGLLLCMQMATAQISAMTYNIRYDNPRDGEDNWHERKELLLNQVRFHGPDFLGTQEALLHQLEYLDKGLPAYQYIGVGRDDGKAGGEFSALFYNELVFDVLDSGTFWLSETPDMPSKGWDAAIKRVCTWGKFRLKSTVDIVWVFNTHFDHRGEKARAESVRLISQKVKEWTNAEDRVVIMGDLNLKPGTAPIQHLASQFADSRHCTDCVTYGTEETFNGFKVSPENKGNRIDYIFTQNLEVKKYAVFSDLVDGRFVSDHFPVMVKLRLLK